MKFDLKGKSKRINSVIVEKYPDDKIEMITFLTTKQEIVVKAYLIGSPEHKKFKDSMKFLPAETEKEEKKE